jgi:hypothetical protein
MTQWSPVSDSVSLWVKGSQNVLPTAAGAAGVRTTLKEPSFELTP